jgi:quercetin dioxygenase-like cupin family protein
MFIGIIGAWLVVGTFEHFTVWFMLCSRRPQERSHRVNNADVRFLEIDAINQRRAQEGIAYLEFLRASSMSAGVYFLEAGGVDGQLPHKQDEMYYVVNGKGRMRAGSDDQSVGPGSLIYVAANVDHSFYAIEEELTVLVFFAPAETE